MLPYKNPELPIDERVEDLLSRMTLEEKCAQLCGDLPASFLKDGKVDHEALKSVFPDGHGRFTQFSTVGLADPHFIARVANEVQRYFVEETRLGIPVALQTENLCGYPGAGGTLFPAQINLGCTWEPELAEEMSAHIGQESRALGLSSAMSPVIDVVRDPRWGRTYETYGEDPYLVSQFGIGYVRGMQGQKMSCIGKHFLGYAVTEGGLNTTAFRMGKRETYEIFATPFEAAAKEAGLDAVMCNYGEIDGLPVIDNPEIIGKLLRDDMGFKGVVTTDGAALMRTHNVYKIGKSYEDAGVIAKRAGTDTEIPVGNAFRKLPEAVRAGKVTEECIDESVRRVLTVKFKCGLFENPYCDEGAVDEALGGASKTALSRKIAADSLVLLKNDGTLPLKKGMKIALVGPHADSLRYPVSGYTYPAYIEMMFAAAKGTGVSIGGMADEQEKKNEKKKSGAPNLFASMLSVLDDEGRSKLNDMNTVLRKMGATSLKEELEKRFAVSYAPGCAIIGDDESGIPAAVEAAKDADVIVMACGGNSGWVNVTGGEGKDRQYLGLPGVQQKLLEAVAATGKPVVMVLYGPQVFALPWAAEHCAAILEAFMPGQYAGSVISDALDGTLNPGGKMTMTVPRNAGQLPIYYNHRIGSGYDPFKVEYTGFGASILNGGYVDGPDTPLYYFGHGLSYTTFALSDLRLAAKEIPTDGTVEATVTIQNTGERAGDEVVQLYTRFTDANVTRPVMSLAAFKRVTLQPGEKKEITFRVKTAQLGYYNENMDFVMEPGVLNLYAGTGADKLSLRNAVTLTGEAVQLKGRRSFVAEAEVR